MVQFAQTLAKKQLQHKTISAYPKGVKKTKKKKKSKPTLSFYIEKWLQSSQRKG
ncbi:hypothetical protein [Nostoc sp. 'Peltigera membranacea cyanobiont' 232]|uniref:hypothetical protein n=1 Tax=Nostoc sp. 'Peltigera membranacea cyanobiont' 232 TaxID=2014531 RepID=UPI001678C0B7|nr:hypothetical protein [Nostoc sp. 'Peltigera membranacea cyanobiont' 232]